MSPAHPACHRVTPVSKAVSAALLILAVGASAAAEPAEVERVVVTGSNIRRTDAESALPVTVITASDIAKSGKSTVSDVLRSLSVNGANDLTDARSFNNFAYGASGISLRGLGPTATLVLVNGRRIAPYAVPDINKGLTSFVNIDAIPSAAIARIEVLRDGASAIYGSDAMAGVVNIILRSEYEGGDLSVNASSNDSGHFGRQSATLTFGHGSLDKQGWNVFGSLDIYHRDQVMFRDVGAKIVDARQRDNSFYYTGRPYSNRFSPYPNYYRGVSFDDSNGASFVNVRSGQPSANCPADHRWAFNGVFKPPLQLCGYSYWQEASQYTSPMDRQTLFTHAERRVSDKLSLFGEVSITHLSNHQRDWPVPFGAGLGATPNGRDGGVSFVPQYLPEGHPNNPFPNQPAGIQYSFADVGMQGTRADNNASRVLLGAKGLWTDWEWEAGLLNSRDTARITYENRISLPVLRDAVLNGTYNFENPGAGAITAKDLRITPVDHGQSQYTSVDAKISGTLGSLPAGPVGVAAGVEARHESRNYTPDERIFSGEVYLQVAGKTSGQRNVSSAFAELSLPLLKGLEAQLAARGDHYSDYGNSFTPKFALSWKASDAVKLRSSVAKGFRAPSLNESANTDTPLFNGIGFDPKRCGISNIDCDGYANSGVAKANPNLKPETSTSQSMGIVLAPTRNLSMTLDYWQFERRNEIDVINQGEVIDHEDSTDPLYAGRVHRLPPDSLSVPGQTIPGRISTVETQFINRGRTQVRGVDLELAAGLLTPRLGAFKFTTSVTYTDRDRVQATDGTWMSRSGYLGNPRVRGSAGVDWTLNQANLGLAVRYISGFKANAYDLQCSGTRYLGVCDVSESMTFDLYAAYQLTNDLRLSLSVLNFTNSKMPFTPTMPLGNTNLYGPEGRYFRLGAGYHF